MNGSSGRGDGRLVGIFIAFLAMFFLGPIIAFFTIGASFALSGRDPIWVWLLASLLLLIGITMPTGVVFWLVTKIRENRAH